MAFATPDVKEYFVTYLIKNVTAMGDTDYQKALLMAFDMLKTVKNDPNRQKAVLFLTDGKTSQGSERAILDLLSSLNAEQNNRVLILTYGLGQDVTGGQTLLEQMANMTVYNKTAGDRIKGHFEHIIDTQTVRNKLGSYYNYFSGVDTLVTPVVTVPYTDFSGLGHIFSVCLPVKNSTKHLKGATCIDMQLEDIRETYGFVETEYTYAFIIDNTNRTLVHPLLPSPGIDVRADPLFVDIQVLEPDAYKNGIIHDMIRLANAADSGLAGPRNKTILKTVTVSRGNSSLDGVNTRQITTHYYWQKIKHTHFSVCFVITDTVRDLELSDDKKNAKQPHYHLVNITGTVPESLLCHHHNQTLIKDYMTIQFSKNAYVNDKLESVDETYIEKLLRYLRGEDLSENVFDLKKDVRTSVAILEDLEERWKISFAPYVYKKYLSTHHGVYQVYPGRQVSTKYDATTRQWFLKAKVNSLKMAIFAASSSVVTLSKALLKSWTKTHTAEDMIWAVMGMDISTHSLSALVNSTVPACSTGQYRCLLMDDNGYLLYHPRIPTDGAVNKHPISLSSVEPSILQSLRTKNILEPNTCTDYAWKQQYHTWRVGKNARPVNNLQGYPAYFFTPVADTNIHLISIPSNMTLVSEQCSSCPSGHFLQNKCFSLTVKCYCSCYTSASYQHCLDQFETTEGSMYVPCTKLQETISGKSELFAKSLPVCFSYKCGDFPTSETCSYYRDCGWCHTDQSAGLGCRPLHHCSYTDIPDLSEVNLVAIVVPVCFLLVLLVIVILLLVVLHRKGKLACYKCVKLPEEIVKPDNAYTLNSAANINRREPREHQESPYHISTPVGFMNHSYATSNHSIVSGSDNSLPPAAQIRYVRQENGKIAQQPVLIIPVDLPQSPVTAHPAMHHSPYLAMNAGGVLGNTGQLVSITAQDLINQQHNHSAARYGNRVNVPSLSSHSNDDGYYEPIGTPEHLLNSQTEEPKNTLNVSRSSYNAQDETSVKGDGSPIDTQYAAQQQAPLAASSLTSEHVLPASMPPDCPPPLPSFHTHPSQRSQNSPHFKNIPFNPLTSPDQPHTSTHMQNHPGQFVEGSAQFNNVSNMPMYHTQLNTRNLSNGHSQDRNGNPPQMPLQYGHLQPFNFSENPPVNSIPHLPLQNHPTTREKSNYAENPSILPHPHTKQNSERTIHYADFGLDSRRSSQQSDNSGVRTNNNPQRNERTDSETNDYIPQSSSNNTLTNNYHVPQNVAAHKMEEPGLNSGYMTTGFVFNSPPSQKVNYV